jgi:hypothetical protein
LYNGADRAVFALAVWRRNIWAKQKPPSAKLEGAFELRCFLLASGFLSHHSNLTLNW